MSLFSRVFKNKASGSSNSATKSQNADNGSQPLVPPKPQREDAWIREHVAAEEVQELLHFCTTEMKLRALEEIFLLLPFRPSSDPSAAKSFIRNFFKARWAANGESTHYNASHLYNEFRLTNPIVLCCIMKWCWSRLAGGVVGWATYELFCDGERNSNRAKNAFDTFIPLTVDSKAREQIIFDFFDLLAAIAANGKKNGLGGRKLSRLAGWWAFEHSDNGGFEAGYRSWAKAADATSHLFFAYLRSLAPSNLAGSESISRLPRSLQALLSQTEYPPQTPTLLQTRTSKVVMIVDSVSPTPYALLRRAKHFAYRDDDPALQRFSEYDDPVQALTAECRRVLDAISSTNQSPALNTGSTTASPTDSSWSRFEDIGFSSVLDGSVANGAGMKAASPRFSASEMQSSFGIPGNDIARPTTPSWADFMSSGFPHAAQTSSAPLLLRPDQILPPINPSRVHSSQSHLRNRSREEKLEPGELASINYLDLDETFWWVWMMSLASEEPAGRKAVFGRCAMIETEIGDGRWLIIEEQVKGASPEQDQGVYLVEKKSRNIFTRRGRGRPSSTGQSATLRNTLYKDKDSGVPPSKTSIGPSHQAAVQAAAAALMQKQKDNDTVKGGRRRGRSDENAQAKTTSVMTVQPVTMKEAGPAMQWARKFDQEAVRAQYLGTADAGRGQFQERGQFRPHSPSGTFAMLQKATSPLSWAPASQHDVVAERELPPVPILESQPIPPPKDKLPRQLVPSQPLPSPPLPSPPLPSPPPPRRPENVDSPDPMELTTVDEMLPLPPQSTPPHVAAVPQANGGGAVAVPDHVNYIMRKSVPRGDRTIRDHPAFRQPSPAYSPEIRLPSPTPLKVNTATAAAAAAKAMSKSTGPEINAEYVTTIQRSRQGSTRGFKAMFNRRRPGGPDILTEQRNQDSLAWEGQPLHTPGRGAPLLRRKHAPLTPTISDAALRHDIPVETADIDQGEPGPIVTTKGLNIVEPPLYSPAITEETDDGRGEVRRFSNFSQTFSQDFKQGPLEDNPAFISEGPHTPERLPSPIPEGPHTPERLPSPIPEAPHTPERLPSPIPEGPHTPEQLPLPILSLMSPQIFRTRAAAMLAPNQPIAHQQEHDPTELVAPISSSLETNRDLADDEMSDQSANLAPQTTQDRWAQIRRNAIERRISEEQTSRQQIQTQVVRTGRTSRTDDGETSGEETIEMRVARIRLRVAQLTGGARA